MLFFNLNLLESKTSNDIEVYQAIYNLYRNKTIKKNIKDKVLILQGLGKGNSFLLNPKPLLETKPLNFIQISQYIKLAGRRSYIMLREYNIRYLDLSYYPDINLSAIKTNKLLKIEKNKIHFKYEEN